MKNFKLSSKEIEMLIVTTIELIFDAIVGIIVSNIVWSITQNIIACYISYFVTTLILNVFTRIKAKLSLFLANNVKVTEISAEELEKHLKEIQNELDIDVKNLEENNKTENDEEIEQWQMKNRTEKQLILKN